MSRVFDQLGLAVVERGWLSSNSIVFAERGSAPATVVDTGYGSHAEQTLSLLQQALGDAPLRRIVNTHLHSDHCGGNARLVGAWDAEVCVPEASFDLARRWDTRALSYDDTGQTCDRFPVDSALSPGTVCRLGDAEWQVLAAAGHDPDAVMLFEAESRVLITADALWEDRLAIVFPEIDGDPGFRDARASLDLIERLQPRIVIPGHGPAFSDVKSALDSSRARLSQFERQPERHLRYATRALTMFHMLEVRRSEEQELVSWLEATPIFQRLHARLSADGRTLVEFAMGVVSQLLADGLLRMEDSKNSIVIA